MTASDLFPYFWLTMVALSIIVSVAWAVNDLRTGSARLGVFGARVERKIEPFEFWLAVLGKLATVPVGGFMFYFGLQMVR